MNAPCTRVTTRKRWAQAKYTEKFSVTGIFRGTQWVLFKLGIIPCQAGLVNGIILEKESNSTKNGKSISRKDAKLAKKG